MPRSSKRAIRVLGLISGTSADGIDVALARLAGRPPQLDVHLEGFHFVPYPAAVRAAVLRIAGSAETTTAEISRLSFLLGELFARAALDALRRFRVRPTQVDLVGSHGQTVFHQGRREKYLLAPVAATLQIAEPAIISARTGIPVVADFRPADIAAGGQGAPLVPLADWLLYRHPRRARVALNLGGIANFTVISPAAQRDDVLAFDTGPGNMLADALVRHYSRGRQHYDRGARMARRGRLLPGLLAELLRAPYFRRPPPKSAGREQFGSAFVERILGWARRNRARPEDVVRTATLLTPLTILDAYHRWVEPQLPRRAAVDWIISGGGAHNPLIRAQLEAGLLDSGRDVRLFTSGELGIPEDAKEAVAFAILAYESWHRRPGNLPRATGAKKLLVLGKVVWPAGSAAPRR